MSQLIECIPNFSEARRPDVVDRIAEVIGSVDGVRLLDRSSDLDHNRSVLTFAGSPAAVEEAAFRAIRQAAELIDLNQHKGEHPRIGATDVVPFVPLAGVSMDDCVQLAHRLGQRVGSELHIPVYLYEYAATRPERTNLENLRRGQFESLRKEIESDPDRKPDYGPAKLGSAGATVIGARDPLIAFNVYLNTSEVEIARKIARAIRQSSGGIRYVKALGLYVEERAQVSINLTNFRLSPIARVVEMVRREAARYGTAVHHCELIGLIPQAALVDAAVWYTQLDQFSPEQILESRLYGTGITANASPEPGAARQMFLEQVASPTPAPGGGSAGAYAGALGAALAEMVSSLTIGRNKYRDVEAEMLELRARAQQLRTNLDQAVEDDANAFDAVIAALRLPKDGAAAAAREQAIEAATLTATRVPLTTAQNALQVMEIAARCARLGNVNAVSDAVSGAVLAHAALMAAAYNVRVNLNGLKDPSAVETISREILQLETQGTRIAGELQQIMRDRAGIA